MTDVVLTLPIREGDEARLFGIYLHHYMEQMATDTDGLSPDSDAPFLMLHSDPRTAGEVKVITFQEPARASAFSVGWDKARRGLVRRRSA